MPLIDKYLSKYTYKEYHDIVINCTKEQAYIAARNLDLAKSRTIKILFRLRGLPTGDLTLKGFIDRIGFTLLEEMENDEFVIGFWATSEVEKIQDRDQFIRDNKSRRLKVVWNFKFDETKEGAVRVSTETRVLCIATVTKIFFSIYWTIIRPFSGLIRIRMLNIIKDSVS